MAKKAEVEKQLKAFERELDRIVAEKVVGRTAQMDRLLGAQVTMYIFTRFMDAATAKRFASLFESAWEQVVRGSAGVAGG